MPIYLTLKTNIYYGTMAVYMDNKNIYRVPALMLFPVLL